MADDVVQGMETAEAGSQPEADEPSALQEELAKAQAQAKEYLDQWRRAAADLANYRKRVEREREEANRFANALLLTRLLPVLDDLDRAMATLPADLGRFSWIEGIVLIQHKLELALELEGLKRIEAAGKPFDPQWHEAVLREETTDYPDGQVIADLQCGYEMHGRVLRPTLVKVAVAPTEPAGAAAAEPGEQAAPPPETSEEGAL